MSGLLGSVATYTVLFTLLVASAEHLSRPAALAEALAAHRVLPAPGVVATLVIVSEGLLAGTGIMALFYGTSTSTGTEAGDGAGNGLLVAVLVGSVALLGLYAAYGLQLISTGRTGSCGCSRVELPMTGWVVARASILASLALVGSLLSGSVIAMDEAGASLAIVLLAAATFTVLLWHLPAAMHDPAATYHSAAMVHPTAIRHPVGMSHPAMTAERASAGRPVGVTEGGLPG